MINVYDVSPVSDYPVSWEEFSESLSHLLSTVADKDHSVVVCRDLPDHWQSDFQTLGMSSEREVAWVRFDHTDGHFHFGFIAWDKEVLIDYVNHVGEGLGGEMTEFAEVENPTIH